MTAHACADCVDDGNGHEMPLCELMESEGYCVRPYDSGGSISKLVTCERCLALLRSRKGASTTTEPESSLAILARGLREQVQENVKKRDELLTVLNNFHNEINFLKQELLREPNKG